MGNLISSKFRQRGRTFAAAGGFFVIFALYVLVSGKLIDQSGLSGAAMDAAQLINDLLAAAVATAVFYKSISGVLNQRTAALETLRLRECALESITQGITVTDETSPDAGIIYTNQAYASMTGYPMEEILGQRLRNFFAPDAAPGLIEKLALARAKQRALRFETKTRRKDGSTFTASICSSPIIGPDGLITHFVAVHEDVTDARLRDQQLHEIQKLETIGQLTGGIAHDFNNLLTVITANAGDLRQDFQPDSLHYRQIDLVLQAAERGAGLVQQLMAFARKQNLEPVVVDVNEMVGRFSSLLRRALPENIEVEIRKGTKIPSVLVDPGRLESALLNLSFNARDAMPDGGSLLIETGQASLDRDYARKNAGVKPGSYVLISVTDSGSGMPPDVVEKAFQPFFTTKEVGKGTGLGLSMVYGFVKQSGGHAKIYSEAGHGTTIKLFLPPTEAQDDNKDREVAVSRNQGLSGRRILLVEDDPLVRQSVSNKLVRLGCVVTAAESAVKAIEVLEKDSTFDLIFTDVIMPGGMSGADLARDAMQRWPQIKLLMTSGYTEASALGKVKIPEGVRFISKPYANADLVRAIDDVIRKSAGP